MKEVSIAALDLAKRVFRVHAARRDVSVVLRRKLSRQRRKNDAADAEAIVEAATRPSMRFVVPKTESPQACSMFSDARPLCPSANADY